MSVHPQSHVSFNEWIKILDNGGLLSREKFFENVSSLNDAMLACWKKLTISRRQEALYVIDDVYASVSIDV